jgi:hypothetical protein
LQATGPRSNRICAFSRAWERATLYIAASLDGDPEGAALVGTSVPFPNGHENCSWQDVQTGKPMNVVNGSIAADDLFHTYPVRALLRIEADGGS